MPPPHLETAKHQVRVLVGSHLYSQRIRGVDDGRLAGASVDDQVAVVVGEHRNGQDFHPWGEQTESGHEPPAGKGGVQAKLPTPYIKFLVKHASGNSVMTTPPHRQGAGLGDTAGPWCPRGSPGLTGEAVGLGHGVAVRIPLPSLLHLPLVEEVAQACAGVQVVPRECRHP